MKTPVKYQKQLKSKFISKEMLSDVLFSLNKRAKNCRDMLEKYQIRYSRWALSNMHYDNISKYSEKKAEYYEKKEKILSILEPTCIHKEIQFIEFDDWDNDVSVTLQRDKYYLFYDFGDRSFHSPLNIDSIPFINNKERRNAVRKTLNNKKITPESFESLADDPQRSVKEQAVRRMFPNIEIIDLPDQIITFGEDIANLLSCQFVNKVISLIESGEYSIDNSLTLRKMA